MHFDPMTFLLALIASGVVTAVLNYFFGKRLNREQERKVNAERQDIIATAAQKAVTLIEGQLDEARRQVTSLETELRLMRAAHDAEVKQYRATIARYEFELTEMRRRVTSLESELRDARKVA
jgi:predicted RNase H-like nuclease (RuvC/YqgF family)